MDFIVNMLTILIASPFLGCAIFAFFKSNFEESISAGIIAVGIMSFSKLIGQKK